jgi:cytochrome c
MRKTASRSIAVAVLFACLAGPALAQLSPAAQRGRSFVTTNCAQCHSVDKYTASPLKIAPPFRTLHERYPVEDLQESLAEGIVVGHPTMPQFKLDPGQVDDVITYLKTLQ